YEKLIDDIQEENYFDDSDFSQTGTGCLGEDLLCELFPDNSFGVEYTPGMIYGDGYVNQDKTTEYNYLILRDMGANKKVFDNISVSEIYLQKYIYNDYIFDEEQGNYLIDFFKKLDENNIHYYIHENTDIDEGYFFYEEEDKQWQLENQSMYCDVNKYRTDKEIKEYLGDQNLEELDMLEYLDFLNCNTELRISFDPENLKEEGVSLEQVEELSKEYYNPDHISLDIRQLSYSDESSIPIITYMDSETEYSIFNKDSIAMISRPPVYNW
ncbi:MAG: hypothetical protein ACK5NF_03945, partial [Bacilli bacterium]